MKVDRRVNTLPVVPDFDVFENSLYGLPTRFELFQIDEFTLDDAVKRLDTRIIKTVAFAAHAPYHFIFSHLVLVVVRGVLAPAI